MVEKRDPRTTDILSFHAAIEQQMDVELAVLLPEAAKLKRLGFSQKIDVLCASTSNPFMPDLALALVAFNNLRNCVAHGESSRVIDKHMERLSTELDKTFRGSSGSLSVHLAAAMIVAALAALNDVDVMITLLGGANP